MAAAMALAASITAVGTTPLATAAPIAVPSVDRLIVAAITQTHEPAIDTVGIADNGKARASRSLAIQRARILRAF